MPEKRLAVLPSEILHLELECERCHSMTVFPFIELRQDPTYQFGQQAMSHCPWCYNEVPNQLGARLRALVEALSNVRVDSTPNLRVVIQHDARNA